MPGAGGLWDRVQGCWDEDSLGAGFLVGAGLGAFHGDAMGTRSRRIEVTRPDAADEVAQG